MKRRTDKDMRPVRRTIPFADALYSPTKVVQLKNYMLNGKPVVFTWDFNKAASRDKMIKLSIGKEEAFIDIEELLSYTRLV